MRKLVPIIAFVCVFAFAFPFFTLNNPTKAEADEIITYDSVSTDVPIPSIWCDMGGNNIVPAFYIKLVTCVTANDVTLVLYFYRKPDDHLITTFDLKSENSTEEVVVTLPFIYQSNSNQYNASMSLVCLSSAASMVGVTWFESYKATFPYFVPQMASTLSIDCFEIIFNGYNSYGADTNLIFRLYSLYAARPVGIDNYCLYRGYVVNTAGTAVIDISDLYSNAYQVGFSEGLAAGVDDGYNRGRIEGYSQGYEEASTVGDISFRSLIASVVDVPVNAFRGLFNFEILGVNLFSFFTGLLTIALVVAVYRMFWR